MMDECCGTCKYFDGENDEGYGFCDRIELTIIKEGWCKFWDEKESEGEAHD